MVVIWQYIIGTIFCVTIIFFKGGITGVFTHQLPELITKVKGRMKNAAG